MSKPSSSRRLSFIRVTSLSLIIGLFFVLTANASAGSGYAFIDSVKEFFGLAPDGDHPMAAFTPGNLVVVQVGDGVAAPTNASAQVALVEYLTSGGSPVQTIAINSTGASPRLTVTGSSTSEGQLVRSSDGNYLTLTGYDVIAGTATGFASGGTPRMIGRVDASGTVDLTTALTDGGTGAVRSAASTDGADMWMTNSSVGLRYKAFGSSGTSTQVTTAPTNTRVVKVFNGQLYMTSGSATFTCVNSVGSGTPTGTGNTTTPFPGMTCSSRSPYSFSISPTGTTMYVADDGLFGSNGGIQKWTFSAGTWTNTYTLLNTGAATTAVRGLTVDWSGANPVIYATTTATTANLLISVTDTGAGATATTIATAPTNRVFRGVDFAPSGAATPTATNTNTPTDTPTDTPTYTPTETATATSTATETATNTPTATPTDSSDIRIIKDDSADPVEELVPFKYEIEIENLGPDTAHDVALQDTIPIEIVFLDLRSTLPIPVGEDLFQTTPGGVSGWGTTPIPPGFFGPGSDPFGGTFQLQGVPTGPMGNDPSGLCPALPGGLMAGPMGQQPLMGSPPACGGPGLGATDTIIRRFNPSGLDIGGGSAVIPIEIVALHLQSVNPITVTYNGGMNPEPWVVDIGLAPGPQPSGQMGLNRNGNTNNGTTSINLPVIRRYTFIDVGTGGYPTVFIDRMETFGGGGSFTQETGSCTTPSPGTTGTISCSGYTLDSFFDIFFEIDVSSTSNAGGSTWSNTATTTATEFDPIPSNNSDTEMTTITEPATPTSTNTNTPTPSNTATETATATATETATATNTPTPPIEITGTVNYGNPVTGPNPRGVPNVLISGAGSPPVSDTTGAPGTYVLTGFGAGSYTVTPSKSGGINGSITGFDAARVAQYLTGNYTFSSAQQTVADVSGAGGISSYDAALIARYALALGPPTGNSGTWLFSPTNRFYASVTGSLSGEDYAALVMGETSGNWGDPTPYRPAFGPEKLPAVAAPRLSTPADNEVIVPVRIDGASDKGIISYEFDLRYDPTVIQPQADPVDVAGTVSSGLFAVANAEGRGLLRVVVYGAMPLESNGVMLNLRFTAVGAPGSVSPLTWERLVLNEGTPRVTATDGQVELVKAAANQAELTGRLLTAFGAGLPNARVTLTDSTGHSRTVLSNGFGAYRFGDLKVGQTYTISVEARNYAFTPITVSVTGQSVTADIIAAQ